MLNETLKSPFVAYLAPGYPKAGEKVGSLVGRSWCMSMLLVGMWLSMKEECRGDVIRG